MSRSRRKTPIAGIACAESEKRDKQMWHRAMRRGEDQRLVAGLDPLASEHAYSDPWGMSKDGKHYWHDWRDYPDVIRK